MKSNTCCIFNIGTHYNAPIYGLMDKELKCEFYMGDRFSYSIELMKYDSLVGFRKKLKFIPLFGNFYWQRGAISLAFKSYKYYIITGEPYCLSSWFVLILNRLRGRKSYLWTHGWYGDENTLKRILKKIFFGLSFKVLLYGNYARNLMIKEGFNPQKLLIIYNSLDYDKQIQIRQYLKENSIYKQHFNNECPVLLYIGRIQRRKKVNLLVEALNYLQNQGIICNLIIIGKEAGEINIQELVEKYMLSDRVWLYGSCYNEKEIGELIYNADVTVVPGDIGLTAMHSLVYGTPVITHNNFKKQGPEFESIAPGINGDFFFENSVEDLCTKVKKWISFNKDQRSIVRENCYEVIHKKYNPHNQIEILKSILK